MLLWIVHTIYEGKIIVCRSFVLKCVQLRIASEVIWRDAVPGVPTSVGHGCIGVIQLCVSKVEEMHKRIRGTELRPTEFDAATWAASLVLCTSRPADILRGTREAVLVSTAHSAVSGKKSRCLREHPAGSDVSYRAAKF